MIEKFQAALLGFAVGDALAAPIEDVAVENGATPVTEYVKAFPSHPVSHLEPGQYSDETQGMLMVAESVVATRGFSSEDFLRRLVDWSQLQRLRGHWRFPSDTMLKACRKLAAGVPATQSGIPSAGVNGMIRTLPLALVYWRTPPLLRDALEKCTRITHTDAKIMATATMLATMIKCGLEGAEPAPESFINQMLERAQHYSPEVPRRLKILRDVLRLEPPVALEQLGNGGYCLEALPAALYWFFRHPKRFDDMLIGAANSGGDADAIAAIAGGIFGAFNGLGAIPARWLEKLEDAQHIKQLGCDLYRLSVTPKLQ